MICMYIYCTNYGRCGYNDVLHQSSCHVNMLRISLQDQNEQLTRGSDWYDSTESVPSAGGLVKEIGARVSWAMSTAVFPRLFLRSTRAPAAKRRDAQSNLPVMMLNISGVAPEW